MAKKQRVVGLNVYRTWGKPGWNRCSECKRPVSIAEIEAGTAVREPDPDAAVYPYIERKPMTKLRARKVGLKIARLLKGRLHYWVAVGIVADMVAPLLLEEAEKIAGRTRRADAEAKRFTEVEAATGWKQPYHLRCKEEDYSGSQRKGGA